MRKKIPEKIFIFLMILAAFTAAGCVTVDFTAPLAGRYVKAAVGEKDFEVIGIVQVESVEMHKVGPLGFTRSVEGAKVNYSDLMIEAAKIEADDIIDVRIDMNAGKPPTFAERLTGWERTFTYTGKALAIRYVDKKDTSDESDESFFRR
jgi:hypothetical protein